MTAFVKWCRQACFPVKSGEFIAVLLVCMTATAVYAALAGQDTNFDQRNYHLYNVYAWLTGRMSIDLAPAQIQTWQNPAPYLHDYWLIRYTRPVVAGTAIGAIAGIHGLLLWILTRRVLTGSRTAVAVICASLVTACGLTGAMFVSFLGRTFGECSQLVLAALICAIPAKDASPDGDARRFLIAGCWLGAASALKLTNSVYAVGMAATLLVLWLGSAIQSASLWMYAAGGAAGFIAVGGYWNAKLWLAMGSPLFPFFNAVFRSPWFEPVNWADLNALPPSFWRATVRYPFEWLMGIPNISNPMVFRDPRFALAAALLALAIVVTLVRSRREFPAGDERMSHLARARDFWCLSLFFLFSYAIGIKQFGIHRYNLALELIAGLVVLLCLDRLLYRRPWTVAAALGLLVIPSIYWTQPPEWGRIPFGRTWMGFVQFQEAGSSTLYVMTGWQPTAYLVPYMPPDNRFVRMSGNLPLEPTMPLGQRALRMIQEHRGPIRTLSVAEIDGDDRARLQRFGLELDPDSCKTYPARIETVRTCALTRTAAPSVASGQ